jgi:hypothetical protein
MAAAWCSPSHTASRDGSVLCSSVPLARCGLPAPFLPGQPCRGGPVEAALSAHPCRACCPGAALHTQAVSACIGPNGFTQCPRGQRPNTQRPNTQRPNSRHTLPRHRDDRDHTMSASGALDSAPVDSAPLDTAPLDTAALNRARSRKIPQETNHHKEPLLPVEVLVTAWGRRLFWQPCSEGRSRRLPKSLREADSGALRSNNDS